MFISVTGIIEFNENDFLIHTNFLSIIWISSFYFARCLPIFQFNKTSLPEKEDFCSHLNMEDITDADYTHRKRDCKDFAMKN